MSNPERLDFPDDLKEFIDRKGGILQAQVAEVSRIVELFNQEWRAGQVLMPTHARYVRALIESTEPLDYLEVAVMFLAAHYNNVYGLDIDLKLFHICPRCDVEQCRCSKFQRFKQNLSSFMKGFIRGLQWG